MRAIERLMFRPPFFMAFQLVLRRVTFGVQYIHINIQYIYMETCKDPRNVHGAEVLIGIPYLQGLPRPVSTIFNNLSNI